MKFRKRSKSNSSSSDSEASALVELLTSALLGSDQDELIENGKSRDHPVAYRRYVNHNSGLRRKFRKHRVITSNAGLVCDDASGAKQSDDEERNSSESDSIWSAYSAPPSPEATENDSEKVDFYLGENGDVANKDSNCDVTTDKNNTTGDESIKTFSKQNSTDSGDFNSAESTCESDPLFCPTCSDSEIVTSARYICAGNPPPADAMHSKCESVAGLNLAWLPFKWLRDPELFIMERRGIRIKNRIHKHADSLFSTSSGFTDFRGFFNLAVLLLVVSSARVALENALKYGLLVNPAAILPLFLADPYSYPSLGIVILTNVFVVFAFMVEKLLASGDLSEGFGKVLISSNLVLNMGIPFYIILTAHPNPVFSSVALLLNTIVFLKLISYHQTLKWCRSDYTQSHTHSLGYRARHKSLCVPNGGSMEEHYANGDVKTLRTYPDNVTFTDAYYFMCAPTLCYELAFPHSKRIRKRFLIKRICEVIFISGLILALIQQWVVPLIHNALVPFNQMDFVLIVERILKLALPNFCIWLLWFYVTFHSMGNVLAEVLMFGDRVFYHDWWNSETVSEFWQKWNIPVHRWAIRHLYKPMMTSGYSKLSATLAVFVFSAVLHEVLVSVPLGIFRLYAFMGMVMQVPLALFTAKLHSVSPGLCNIIMWCSLLIGQPIAVLMYYVDYYITTQT